MHLLTALSLKNRSLIALVTVVIAIFGALSLTSLKQELIPSVEFPTLTVVTTYPGATPEVVNQEVSTPIEAAIASVPDLESTSATSSTNSSVVSATFAYGTNLATAEQKISQAISRISSTLPSGVDPQVVAFSLDDLPVIALAVTDGESDPGSSAELLDKLNGGVLSQIEDLDGVNSASLTGDRGERITITPDPEKLAEAGLTTQDITDTINQSGLLQAAGEITEDGKTLSVQVGDRLTSVKQIEELPMSGTVTTTTEVPGASAEIPAGVDPTTIDPSALAGAPTTQTTTETVVSGIADVADVEVVENPETSVSRVNGESALSISITKLPSANTVEVSTAVRGILPDIQAQLGAGVTVTVVFDQAPYIQQSIEALATEGLLGLVFAIIVILLFLLSVRSTLVTAISIPLSVLITFIGLQTAGYSLNILTLGALTIAIGRVVDDSIVVIENIKRHLESAPDRQPETRRRIIITAVREVTGAITASTVTTVAVFLPIALVGGTVGELFRPFALTVSIALLASLVVALTIVPVLAYWFLRAKPAKAHKHAEEPADPAVAELAEEGLEKPGRLQRGYLPVIHWTLKRPVATLLLAVLALGGTVALVPSMKTNFLGDSGQNTLSLNQTLPNGTSLEALDEAATKVDDVLRAIPGIETVQLTIGSSGSSPAAVLGGGGGGVSYQITTDESADQVALKQEVLDKTAALTDVGEITASSQGGFGSSDIEVDVQAVAESDLKAAADDVVTAMQGLSSISQVESNLSASSPYIAVEVDRTKAAEAGLSELAVGSIVSQAMQPSELGSIVIDDSTLSIYLESNDPPTTLAQLKKLEIPTATGIQELSDLATVEQTEGPASVTTINGVRSVTVTVTPAGDDLGTATAQVTQAINDLSLEGGATASIGGVASDQSDAFSQLGLALLIAILIVYVVMVATFRSLLQPLLLLVSVPFAATGAIALQIISDTPLGVSSLIGVLMLIGIVVTNAIVLVDLVNQYRLRGMRVREAVIHGSSRRLRPILMTAAATILALTPMAIGITGHGGFISQPLAIVVIGGLLSSTVLTLIVLPALYSLVESARERRADRRAARLTAQDEAAAVPAGTAPAAEASAPGAAE